MSESTDNQHQDEEASTAYGAVPEGVTPERDQAKAPPELVPNESDDTPSQEDATTDHDDGVAGQTLD